MTTHDLREQIIDYVNRAEPNVLEAIYKMFQATESTLTQGQKDELDWRSEIYKAGKLKTYAKVKIKNNMEVVKASRADYSEDKELIAFMALDNADTENVSDLTKKISEGLKKSFDKLVRETAKENGELIFSRDGKIVRVKAKDLLKS